MRSLSSLVVPLVALQLAGCVGTAAGMNPEEVDAEVGGEAGGFFHQLQGEGTVTTGYALELSEADQDVLLIQLVGLTDGTSSCTLDQQQECFKIAVLGDEGVSDTSVPYQGGATSLTVTGADDVHELQLGTAVRGELAFDTTAQLGYAAYCQDVGDVTLTASADPAVEGGDASVTIHCTPGESDAVVINPSQGTPLPGGGFSNGNYAEVSFLLAPNFPNQAALDATERYLLVLRDTGTCTDPFETNSAVFAAGRSSVGVFEGTAGKTSMYSPVETGTVSVWVYAYAGSLTPCQTDSWCAGGETCNIVAGGVGLCGEPALQAGGCGTLELGASTDCDRGDGSSFNGCASVTLAAAP